jgi:O-methyltransferase involved in polyketide biosynthesis
MVKDQRALFLAELTAGMRALSAVVVPGAKDFSKVWMRFALSVLKPFLPGTFVDLNALREEAMFHWIAALLPEQGLIVDVGSGFSTIGYRLAKANSSIQVLELDLDSVIEEKCRRVARLGILPNWQGQSFDLKSVSLSKLLSGQRAAVISAQGLLPYLLRTEILALLRDWRSNCLVDSGCVVFDLIDGSYNLAVADQEPNSPFKNRFSSVQAIQDFVLQAGFSNVEAIALHDLAKKLGRQPKGKNAEFICRAGHFSLKDLEA